MFNLRSIGLFVAATLGLGLLISCGNQEASSPVSANTGSFTSYGATTTVPTVDAISQPMYYGNYFYQTNNYVQTQVTVAPACTSSCSAIASVPCGSSSTVLNVCSNVPFVMTVPGTVDPSGQISYQHAQTCESKNELLGSLMFAVTRIDNSNIGRLDFVWNQFVSRGGNDPVVSHYRVVVYGTEGVHSASNTWVSPRIYGTSIALTPGVLSDVSGASMLSGYNISNQALGNVVDLSISDQNKYWYQIFAMDANDNHILVTDHLGVQHVSQRQFDVIQIACSSTVVAGFCSN